MTRSRFAVCLFLLVPGITHAQDNFEKLYAAIRTDDVSKLTSLLDGGISANTPGPGDATALHDAVAIGSVEAMKTLIAHGAEVNAKDVSGAVPLIFSTGNIQKVRLLLDSGADVSGAEGARVLQAAIVRGSAIEVVRALIEKGADIKAAASTRGLLHAAARRGNTEVIALLLENGANVNAEVPDGGTPVMSAAVSRRTAAVKLLLANGAKVDVPIDPATVPTVKLGKVERGGETPLTKAASYGPVDLVKALLDAGADVNARNVKGMTPLMYALATDYQNPEIIRLLLARGADTKIKSHAGETALELAYKNGSADGIKDDRAVRRFFKDAQALCAGTIPRITCYAGSGSVPASFVSGLQKLIQQSMSWNLTRFCAGEQAPA